MAMNVDEAMAVADSSNFSAEYYDGSLCNAIRVLRKEVERLRAELARCQSLLDETRTELSICQSFHAVAKKEWQLEVEKVNRLEAELAEAKAASVVPVEITDLKKYNEEIGCYEDEDPRSMRWVGCDGLP